MYTIMLIDDEENILKALVRIFGRTGLWEVEAYAKPDDALKRARTKNFDLFLSDYRMPGMDGVELLTEIKKLQPDSMRLILSGHTEIDALMAAINNAEIFRFIIKPWQDEELILTLQQALKYRDMLLENRYLAEQVREQQDELNKQKNILMQYKEQHPELFKVNWSSDGSIIITDDDV